VLAQDASFRRYLRLHGGPRPALLMDAPPGREDVRPFLRLAARLTGRISVPEIIAADAEAGLVLLEDFGDTLIASRLGDAASDAARFDAAIDTLAALHEAPADLPPWDLPPWDAAAMAHATAATFLDWWWPAATHTAATPALRADFAAAMEALLAPLASGPRGFVHRDYFVGNLFWLPERAGIRRIGVIDFQDAGIGHPAYDVVSLVEDARRDLPEALRERAIARYLARRPELDAAAFRDACVICAAQRHLRVAALWVRLARRDGKPAYLAHAPRCWAMLRRALAAPPAAPLAGFLARHMPSLDAGAVR
jgi:aminoglycoside/choline kinase family phosphotransferase